MRYRLRMFTQAHEKIAPVAGKVIGTLRNRVRAWRESKPKLNAKQRLFWEKHGFLVLPKHFSRREVRRINALVDRLWAERRTSGTPLVIDTFLGLPEQQRILLRDASDQARHAPYKLNDLFLEHREVLEMSADREVCAIISDLLEGDPIVCNNLTFELGSEQDFHFDTFYMPAPVENKMVASWVALEDVHPDSGPLRYYPGSHKIPPYRFSDGRLQVIHEELGNFEQYIGPKLKEFGLEATTFKACAGDVFIWHSQLFHGGSPIHDRTRTRKSLVTHYFRAEDFSASDVATSEQGLKYLKREHPVVPKSS